MPERMEDLRAGQMVGKRGSLETRKTKADSASNAPVEILRAQGMLQKAAN